MWKHVTAFICCGLLSAACTDNTETVEVEKKAAPAAVIAEPPPLVERQDFFDNPTQTQGRISPDGKWVSWLAPVDGVMNV